MSGSISAALPPNTDGSLPRRSPDAIRYILLRKLASGLRHAMMGELQTLQFNAELCAQMLQGGRGGGALASHLNRLPAQTKAATATCRAAVEWLRPDSNGRAPLGEVFDSCVKLVGDDWMLRGVETCISIAHAERSAVVAKAPSSEMIVASLLTLVDIRDSLLDIHAEASLSGEWVTVRMSAAPPSKQASLTIPPVYARLGFDDVFALAAENGVECRCDAAGSSVELRLPSGAPAPAGRDVF